MDLIDQYKNLHSALKEQAIKVKENGEKYTDLYRYRFQVDGYEEFAMDFPVSDPLSIGMIQDLLIAYIRFCVHDENLEGAILVE